MEYDIRYLSIEAFSLFQCQRNPLYSIVWEQGGKLHIEELEKQMPSNCKIVVEIITPKKEQK